MPLLEIKALTLLKKYFRIYKMLWRYQLMRDLQYKGNFFVSFVVEFCYQASFWVIMGVMLSKTNAILGWNINELLVILGLDTLASEFIAGMVIVWNTRELPDKIWSGELDRILLRPIHPLFTLILGRPYLVSTISAITGVILIMIGVVNSGATISLLGLVTALLFFVMGYVLLCLLVTNISLCSFFFQDTYTLPQIGERFVFNYPGRPAGVYQGVLKLVFFVFIPVVYVASFSAQALVKGIDWDALVFCFGLLIVSIFLTNKLWQKAVSNYASASS